MLAFAPRDRLNERDMLRPKLDPPRGVLHARAQPFPPGYGRYWPCDELAPFVEHFWTVAWDEPTPVTREVLPHPSVHLVIEAGASAVAGVPAGRFSRRLEGQGRVLGTKFRPGGFRPFVARPISTLTARTVPLVELFGPSAESLEAEVLALADPAAGFALVQSFLLDLRPRRDPQAELAARIAERAATDRDIVRADELARAFSLSLRALQRLFADYVGVPPKWVIQRYRLHEAAERIAAGGLGDGATLAHDLGFADQAHFIRAFKRVVGHAPGEYAERLGSTVDRAEGSGRS